MTAIEVGYDPFISSSRVQALERAIKQLDKEVRATKAPRINTAWRRGWSGFVQRWQIERDSYASWGDKLSPIEGGARLDAFGNNYLWWAASFEERTGSAVKPTTPEPDQDLSDDLGDAIGNIVPTPVWLIVGAGVLVFAYSRRF